MITAPSTFGELVNQDLAGFVLTQVYWLSPNHSLWGDFPAIMADSKDPVICLNEKLLRQVEEYLPQKYRKTKIIPMWALVHREQKYGFWINFQDGQQQLERKPFRIMDEEDFALLTADPGWCPFEWKPGLMQTT